MKYTTIQGDMWDSIAYSVYGDCKYTNILINANLKYRDIIAFGSGVELEVPDVNTNTYATTTVPWKLSPVNTATVQWFDKLKNFAEANMTEVTPNIAENPERKIEFKINDNGNLMANIPDYTTTMTMDESGNVIMKTI